MCVSVCVCVCVCVCTCVCVCVGGGGINIAWQPVFGCRSWLVLNNNTSKTYFGRLKNVDVLSMFIWKRKQGKDVKRMHLTLVVCVCQAWRQGRDVSGTTALCVHSAHSALLTASAVSCPFACYCASTKPLWTSALCVHCDTRKTTTTKQNKNKQTHTQKPQQKILGVVFENGKSYWHRWKLDR